MGMPTSPASFPSSTGLRFSRMRFIRIAVLASALGLSLAILVLRAQPLEPAAHLALSAVLALVGLEVVLLGTYQVLTSKPLPGARWASLLLGAPPPTTPVTATNVRLLGGLLLVVGLAILFGAANVWFSPP